MAMQLVCRFDFTRRLYFLIRRDTDWHLVHIGGYATRGAGAITMEVSNRVLR